MNTMCASFDVISIGIVITDADCRIIHVNAAGERMLRERSPISRIEGKLQSSLPAATAELTRAISLCNGKHSISAAGIGIPLTVGSEHRLRTFYLSLVSN
ncbi:MAG: PAS domain-containing protein [Hyphomicrobium sp.]|nr:PAS domain-containing protein [Hyphomicrobium sp.]